MAAFISGLGKLDTKLCGPSNANPTPPLAFSCKFCPLQRGELLAKTGTGNGYKLMFGYATEVQPKAEPIKVYWLFAIGESVKLVPVALTELEAQVYEFAPVAVRVPTASGQIDTFETDTSGLAIKLTEIVAVDKQLFASVLFKVYT